MKDIENILLTLDKIFTEVEFDLDKKTFADGNTKWEVYVNDFDFYMNDKKFKKWIGILRKKYPNTKWYCVYQPNRF